METLVKKQATSPHLFGQRGVFTRGLSVRRGNEGEVAYEKANVMAQKKDFIEYNRAYIDYAKQNRKKPTKVERIFRTIVKDRKFLGYKFKRQKVIGPFILGFYCSELLLGIELDGGYHDNRKAYDSMRDSEIYKKGILVIRFKNEDIEDNLAEVVRELEQIIKERRETFLQIN